MKVNLLLMLIWNVFSCRSLSTVSFIDEPRDVNNHPSLRFENTYQLKPKQKISESTVHNILKEVLESYLAEEKYEPELCKQMTKTISEVSLIPYS